MDVTPLVPEGRQTIDAYGNGGFRIAGQRWTGSVIVFPHRTLAWSAASFEDVDPDRLDPVVQEGGVQVLLLGCGRRAQFPDKYLREKLREQGVVVEPMDTGAAARTFNVLLAEERAVAAALLAVE